MSVKIKLRSKQGLNAKQNRCVGVYIVVIYVRWDIKQYESVYIYEGVNMKIFSLSRDLGIDLGTANTLVFIKGKGIYLSEPSVVAVNSLTNEILSVGDAAKEMIGRTPGNIVAIRPMKDGVIADYETTQAMLKYFIHKATQKSFGVRPRLVVCVPSLATPVEKRAIMDAALSAGAKDAYLIDEPMAAAIGAGLPVEEPSGSMIVDIGGGTTEVAVISLSGIVTCKLLRMAGDTLDEYIVSYIRREYSLAIGERTAEEIKVKIGCVFNADPDDCIDVRGRDLITGLPKTISFNAEEALTAIAEPVNAIVDAIKYTLERTPPELASDIITTGITLSGGGALLNGLDQLIAHETGIPVHVAEEPLNCVALGTGIVLEHADELKSVLISRKKLNM